MGSHKTMLGSGAYDYILWVFYQFLVCVIREREKQQYSGGFFFSFDVLKLPAFSPSNAIGLY